jgi:NAD(P)-dependent dehydrogenase (short-subunit alcohol dehydrogenase family)
MKKLQNKVAVIYGNGGVGGTLAKSFAREGAKVYLTGRTLAKMKSIADEILSDGGDIETDLVDALDESAVEKHMNEIIRKSGKIDISFNAIGLPQTGIQGIPLKTLPLTNFIHPITTYSQSHFITAKAAITHMVQQGNGVIIMNTPSPGRISVPFMGGMPLTWAAIEALSRSIAAEYGTFGVRSVCILTTAMPDSPLIDEVYQIHGKAHGTNYEQFRTAMESRTHRKKLTTLEELANAAVFVASDEGSAITGTILNLTAGLVVT